MIGADPRRDPRQPRDPSPGQLKCVFSSNTYDLFVLVTKWVHQLMTVERLIVISSDPWLTPYENVLFGPHGNQWETVGFHGFYWILITSPWRSVVCPQDPMGSHVITMGISPHGVARNWENLTGNYCKGRNPSESVNPFDQLQLCKRLIGAHGTSYFDSNFQSILANHSHSLLYNSA